jgi:hypothetical protein
MAERHVEGGRRATQPNKAARPGETRAPADRTRTDREADAAPRERRSEQAQHVTSPSSSVDGTLMRWLSSSTRT